MLADVDGRIGADASSKTASPATKRRRCLKELNAMAPCEERFCAGQTRPAPTHDGKPAHAIG